MSAMDLADLERFDDEDSVESRDSSRCCCDIHIHPAALAILFGRLFFAALAALYYGQMGQFWIVAVILIYSVCVSISIVGHRASRAPFYWPFLIADIGLNIIFGFVAFGLLLFGGELARRTELFDKAFKGMPMWFCAVVMTLFVANVYSLNVVFRSQRYVKSRKFLSSPRPKIRS